MSKKKVLTGAERKAQLLEAGAKLAVKHGASNVTRRMVAEACKCAEGLVSVYMGTSAEAQKAYARKAKALGLTLPDKAKTEALGAKLRAHGPRDKRDTRKRSAKEVEAIKRKRAKAQRATPFGFGFGNSTAPVHAKKDAAATRATAALHTPARKPVEAPTRSRPSPGKAPTPPERKSAARKPKAYPVNDGPPQTMPPMPVGAFP